MIRVIQISSSKGLYEKRLILETKADKHVSFLKSSITNRIFFNNKLLGFKFFGIDVVFLAYLKVSKKSNLNSIRSCVNSVCFMCITQGVRHFKRLHFGLIEFDKNRFEYDFLNNLNHIRCCEKAMK